MHSGVNPGSVRVGELYCNKIMVLGLQWCKLGLGDQSNLNRNGIFYNRMITKTYDCKMDFHFN